MRAILAILLASVLVSGLTLSSYASGPGTTAANFLKIGIGARATAMGEAFTALADDGTSIYWNPAGLVQVKKRELLAMYNIYFEEIKQGYLSLASPLLQGTIGLGFNYLHMGDIEGTDAQGNLTGYFSASDFQASLAYARSLSPHLSFGISAGILQDAIKEDKKTAFLANVGLLLKTSRLFSFGLVFQNIGSKLGEGPLPFTFRGGVAVMLEPLNVEVDIVKPSDNETHYCVGVEWQIKEVLALRSGYKARQDIGPGMSIGIGLSIKQIQFNYAYVSRGDLGHLQKVSSAIRF